VLAEFGPGAVFGEIALLDGGLRSADATALTDCTLLVFERRDFLPLLERNWRLAEAVLRVVCGRLRRADAYIAELAFSELPVRLARTLIARAQRDPGGGPAWVGDTQGALAAMVGGSREAVNRCLGKWQRAGLVTVSEGRISLPAPDDLARAVGDLTREP
jgi:CRP-like cAMP-binding protein